jgi:hypothetical protein
VLLDDDDVALHRTPPAGRRRRVVARCSPLPRSPEGLG